MGQILKILIAYDGSQCSNAALKDLRRAGLPSVVEAMLVTLADVIVPPSDDELPDVPAIRIPEVQQHARAHAAKAINEACAYAELAATRLQAYFPGWQVKTKVDCDSPAWAVIRMAADFGTDLVVVGSHGHSSAGGRLIMGSVSQRVLYEAGCSVRVARCSDERRDGLVRIVVGFNESQDSLEAVEAVASRAWPVGTEVRVVTAMDASKPESHARATDKLRAAGLATSEINRVGDPAHALIKEAEEWGADSIFVGTRDLHGFRHLLYGSVSSAVAAQALCSVEVVRPTSLKKV
ncbi:MAG: universal stress protein [Pyrinomonadaceae bacterium]